MADREIVDALISTYRNLNMKVRPLPEERLRVKGDAGSVHEVVRHLRQLAEGDLRGHVRPVVARVAKRQPGERAVELRPRRACQLPDPAAGQIRPQGW